MTPAPAHVLAAFGLPHEEGQRLSGRAWRHGDVVLTPRVDPMSTAWAATVFESLRVSGIRVSRPVRALDGRWVVGGWCAARYVSGRLEGRYDDIIEASFRLHDALREVPVPRFLAESDDLSRRADALAWGERADDLLGVGRPAERWQQLASARRPIDLTAQLIHAELFGHVLFAGSAPPAIVGFAPLVRPAEYAAAIVVVDAVAWGGADIGLARRWDHLSCWSQVLRRAMLYRMAWTAAHPRSTPEALVRIMTAVDLLEEAVPSQSE